MTDKVRVIKIDTSAATTSVKELRDQLKQLKDTMVSTEQGTEEYNAALQQAADISHTLKEQTEEINASAMDFGQITSNATKAVGGLVAGFQAATAVMNLFGIENEEILESMKKMQSLMALTQSFSSIDNGIKGFKRLGLAIKGATAGMSGFKKALISTGFGALVVALGMVVAHFDDISKWIDKITGKSNALGVVWDNIVAGMKAGLAGLQQTFIAIGKTIYTYVVAPFQSAINSVKAFTSSKGGIKDRLAAAGKAGKDTFVDAWSDVGESFKQIGAVSGEAFNAEMEKRTQERLKKEREEREKAEKEALDKYRKAEEEKLKIREEILKRSGKSEVEQSKSQLEIEKERLKLLDKGTIAYEQQLTKIYNIQKQIQEASNPKKVEVDRMKEVKEFEENQKLQLSILQDNLDKGLISQAQYNERKKELDETYRQDYKDFLNYILEDETLSVEDRISLYEKLHEAQVGNTEENKDVKKTDEPTIADGITEAINASALALGEFSNNPAWGDILKNIATLTANWQELNKKIESGGKDAFGAYAQIAAVAFSSVATMMDGLAAEQDTNTKEGFEQNKKYQYASTVMNILSGTISAWASAMQLPFPANVIVGAAMSTMIDVMGIIQLAKIKKQQFGTSGGSSSSATPSTGALSTINAPVQYTQDVQGASIEESLKDTKVYVTESDITNTQNKVEVAESEARF